MRTVRWRISYPLRGGAVQLPSGVEHLAYYRHAQHRDAFAFTGTIYVGEPGKATPHISLYVVGEDDRVTAYGEAMNFSEISELRWSPDDSAISFIANFALLPPRSGQRQNRSAERCRCSDRQLRRVHP